jgi:hypothetical protein
MMMALKTDDLNAHLRLAWQGAQRGAAMRALGATSLSVIHAGFAAGIIAGVTPCTIRPNRASEE